MWNAMVISHPLATLAIYTAHMARHFVDQYSFNAFIHIRPKCSQSVAPIDRSVEKGANVPWGYIQCIAPRGKSFLYKRASEVVRDHLGGPSSKSQGLNRNLP
jgi:hypothetical protein